MSKEDAKKSTIIDHADVRRMLITIKSYVDAMRYLMYDNQLMLDLEYFAEGELKEFGEERCGILTPITKAWISDLGVDCLLLLFKFMEEWAMLKRLVWLNT